MAELAIEAEFLTDVGRKRRHNEDFVDCFEPADPEELVRSGRLYIVADGVGGAADGEVASEYAVKKVLHEYYRSTEPDLGERLKAIIRAANADIFEHVQRRPELGRMGTTIVVAAVRDDELVVANVGDSRAYLIRNGEIHQITRDHSLVAKLVDEGSITPEEAESHPRRNVLLRSIGADPDTYPDTFEGRLQPGDQVVLCSDGLTRYVSDDEMLDVATHTRADRAVRQLVETANARGGKDNISVGLIRATEAASHSVLAGPAVGLRAPDQPEFDAIHDTVSRRRTAPHRRRLPRWAWLAYGGAAGIVGILLLAAVLFFGGSPIGVRPTDTPTSDLSSYPTTLPVTQTLTLQPGPTPTSQPSSTPTVIPSPPQSRIITFTMSYKVPPVKQGLGWIAETWGAEMECISDTNKIENPDQLGADDVLSIPGHCLTDNGPVGRIVFAGIKPEAGPTPFVLDIMNGSVVPAEGEVSDRCTVKPEDDTQSIPSPDNTWIASIEFEPGVPDARFGNLLIRGADETVVYTLTLGYCAADPIWSPNGRYVAFTSRCRVTEQSWERISELGEIWVVPAPATVSKSVNNPREAGHVVVTWPGLERICCWTSELEPE